MKERLFCRPRPDGPRDEPRPGSDEPSLEQRRISQRRATGVPTSTSTCIYSSPSVDVPSLSTPPSSQTDSVNRTRTDHVGRPQPSYSSGVSVRTSWQSTDSPAIPGGV